MHTKEIKVWLLAKPQVLDNNVGNWLQSLEVDDEAINRILNKEKTSGEKLIELAGRRCYKSFQPFLNPNVTKIREDIGEYIQNILKVGHGSVIEHATFSFAIENVTRVFTGEMNRHRAGMAISEGSMRYIRYDDIPFWMPLSIIDEEGDSKEIKEKKEVSRKIFVDAFTSAENYYKQLLVVWGSELAVDSKFKMKKEITSMMRRIIPMGVCTGGLWSGNLRALRHIFEMRCSPAAEEEILVVACSMLQLMREVEPNFFADFEKVEKYWRPGFHKV